MQKDVVVFLPAAAVLSDVSVADVFLLILRARKRVLTMLFFDFGFYASALGGVVFLAFLFGHADDVEVFLEFVRGATEGVFEAGAARGGLLASGAFAAVAFTLAVHGVCAAAAAEGECTAEDVG